jgi:hypothetical protein
MFWNGSLSKALTDAKGVPHLVYLATGPILDRQTERMTDVALGKFEAAAKAGKAFLVPGHDVVFPLAKSVDAPRTENGEMLIDFAFDREDQVAMRMHRLIESGELKTQVSIGAERVTKNTVWDKTLGKSITEITDIDVDEGIHVALCFPGRAVYQGAGLVQALTKAFKGDPAELAKRGWPKDAIEKAVGPDGEYIPPTFAARYAQQQLSEELPDMLDTLRWTIEDILSAWTAGDKPALLAATFREFAAVVGQEITDAGGLSASGDPALAKAEPECGLHKDSPPEPTPPVPPPDGGGAVQKVITEPDTPALKAVTALQEIVTKGFAQVKGEFEALRKAKAADDSVQKATPPAPVVPVVPDTDPASAPDTGCKVDSAADNKASARKAIEDRVDGLRKAIDAEHNRGRRSNLQQEHAGLLAKLTRMP